MRMIMRTMAAIGFVGAMLVGCERTRYVYIHDGQQTTTETRVEGDLRLVTQGPPASDGAGNLTWTWQAEGTWPKPSAGVCPMVHLKLSAPQGSTEVYQLYLSSEQAQSLVNLDLQASPTPGTTIDRPAGQFVIRPNRDRANGTVLFSPSATYSTEVQSILQAQPDPSQMLRLAVSGPDLAYLRGMRQAGSFSLDDICNLYRYSVSAQYVASLAKAGYTFSAAELIELSRYSVNSDYAGSLRNAGYRFSSADLIQLSRYSVGSTYATALRKAGYEFDTSQLIELSRYSISADFATRVKAAGCSYGVSDLIQLSRYSISTDFITNLKTAGCDYSVQDLIQLSRYSVNSDYIRTLREGGYKLTVGQLIELSRYSISSDYALGMRKAGYDFSVEDLIKLSRYSVPVDFAAALHDPALQNLTAQDLIDLHRQGISAQTLRRLRAPRPVTTQPV